MLLFKSILRMDIKRNSIWWEWECDLWEYGFESIFLYCLQSFVMKSFQSVILWSDWWWFDIFLLNPIDSSNTFNSINMNMIDDDKSILFYSYWFEWFEFLESILIVYMFIYDEYSIVFISVDFFLKLKWYMIIWYIDGFD